MHPAALTRELEALRTLLVGRLEAHLVAAPIDGSPLPLPDLDPAVLAPALDGREPTPQEHVLLLLALVPHLDPDFFSGLVAPYLPEGGELPVFGGVRTENHRGVLPTGETAQFVLAGDDLGRRLEVARLLSGDHWLTQRRLLWLDGVREGEPVMSGRLILDSELVERLTTGGISLPRFSSSFPAEHVQTELDWDDVVLHPTTVRQIGEIEDWVRHEHTAREDWGMGRRVARGYRALFHGAPGTGKTLTAMLLGRSTGRAVFRIDLSRVVSKYIGETEKNLAGLFDKAEHKDWILFFDEADALFGKRTEIRDAHDKYANQEVAFLLQRLESHAGLVILATNQRGNLDEAFMRRFQGSIAFPAPSAEDRLRIWQKVFPSQVEVGADIDWPAIARRFELTGAGIVNVAHHCAIETLAQGMRPLESAVLEAAILRELGKEGRMV